MLVKTKVTDSHPHDCFHCGDAAMKRIPGRHTRTSNHLPWPRERQGTRFVVLDSKPEPLKTNKKSA